MSGTVLDLLLIALPVAFAMFVVLNFGGILGWVERKQSAIMQDRIGANRASIFGIRVLGLLHPVADAIKLLTKEAFMPARADRLMFASDYPWENMEEAAAFIDAAPLSPADREKIEWRNAAELYGLDVGVAAGAGATVARKSTLASSIGTS